MQNELFGHIRSEINQRTTNPYLFCFITALAFYNYDLVLIALSGTSITYKLALMSSAIRHDTLDRLLHPAVYAFLVFILLPFTIISKFWWEKFSVYAGNEILKIQDKKTIPMSDHRAAKDELELKIDQIDALKEKNKKLLNEISNIESSLESLEIQIRDRDDEINTLNTRVSNLSIESEKYKSSLRELSDVSMEYKTKAMDLHQAYQDAIKTNSTNVSNILKDLDENSGKKDASNKAIQLLRQSSDEFKRLSNKLDSIDKQ